MEEPAYRRPRRGIVGAGGSAPTCATELFGVGAAARPVPEPRVPHPPTTRPQEQRQRSVTSAPSRLAPRASPAASAGAAARRQAAPARRVRFADLAPSAPVARTRRGAGLVDAARALAAAPDVDAQRGGQTPVRPPVAGSRVDPIPGARTAQAPPADQVSPLRREIKNWERSFASTHGRSPRREDTLDASLIPAAILNLYRQYARLRGDEGAKGGSESPRSVGALVSSASWATQGEGAAVSAQAGPPAPPPPQAQAQAQADGGRRAKRGREGAPEARQQQPPRSLRRPTG